LRFVEDKISEFAKRPFAKSLSLLFINRCPKALEVFECNSSFGVFSFKNNLLGNGVVYMPFESSFSARQLFEASFGRFRAFRLQDFFEVMHSNSNFVNCYTREGFSIRIRSSGKVDDTHINAKIAFGFDWYSIEKLYAEAKAKLTFLVYQISLTSYSALFEFKFNIRAEDNGNFESSINRKNADGIQTSKGKNALVIDYRRMFLEKVKAFLFSLVAFGYFADSPNSHLSRKTIGVSDMSVAKMVESNLTESLLVKGNLRNIVAGIVEKLHSFYQRSLLLYG